MTVPVFWLMGVPLFDTDADLSGDLKELLDENLTPFPPCIEENLSPPKITITTTIFEIEDLFSKNRISKTKWGGKRNSDHKSSNQ